MFLHLGGGVSVRLSDILYIQDFVQTKASADNRRFWEQLRQKNSVRDLSLGKPRSLILTHFGVRVVLEALRRADPLPSPELTDMLRVLAAGTDTMTAVLAQVILIHWGYQTPVVGPRAGVLGLWREPEGIVPEPLTELDDAQ